MVKPEWGMKRNCPKCGERFYDLGVDEPVVCIECGNKWYPEPVLKSKQPIPFEEEEKKKETEDADLADEDPIPAEGGIIVSLPRLQAEGATLLNGSRSVGVRLNADEPVEAIVGFLPKLSLVALVFPKFRDGRQYSSATLLRERYGFKGEVRAVGEVLSRGERVPGFGHSVYLDIDPRAVVLLDLLRGACGRTRAMDIVDDVYAAVGARIEQKANVDFALGALAMIAAMPPDGGEVIMSVARIAGWLAHAIEEYGERPVRFRPRASYIS